MDPLKNPRLWPPSAPTGVESTPLWTGVDILTLPQTCCGTLSEWLPLGFSLLLCKMGIIAIPLLGAVMRAKGANAQGTATQRCYLL